VKHSRFVGKIQGVRGFRKYLEKKQFLAFSMGCKEVLTDLPHSETKWSVRFVIEDAKT
jgi:hypothetical protein